MKKKNNEYIELKRPVNLFREDLLEIEKILVNELKSKEIKISFGEYEAKSINEIPENFKSTSNIDIKGSSPYFSVRIWNRYSLIWMGEENLLVLGAAKKIMDILNKKKMNSSLYFRRVSMFFCFAFSVVILGISFNMDNLLNSDRIILLLGFIIAVILFNLMISYPVKSRIEFFLMENTPNFFQRNKDQILVGLIVAVVTMPISFFLGFYFGK